tara:strand:+ start:2080 stop:3618 length:1539 start_codon:yes stop_codon:yes gene_type:complete
MAKTPNKKKPTAKAQQAYFDKKLIEAGNLIQQGRSSEALSGILQMVKIKPNDYRVYDCLCSANSALGRHAEAIEAGAKAVALAPKAAPTRMRYAKALQSGGHYEEAIIEFERTLYHMPGNLDAMRGKLNTYSDIGDNQQALKELRALEAHIATLDLPPSETIGLAIDKARLAPKAIDAQEAIDELIPLATNPKLHERFRSIALHHIGRLYETQKDYDNAFKYFKLGNDLKKEDWNPDLFDAYIDRLIKCWKGIAKVPTATVPLKNTIDPSRLIFVVGMMRSGTSMTEQMLAQIPTVTPGGEMNAIARAPIRFESLPNPTGGRALPVTRLIYNQRVINEMAKGAAVFYNEVANEGIITDKQPYNTFYVPLITRLFPGAKIIHCCRDAQDTCLSNFTQTFARPHPQTNDLYWIGRYHKTYQRMMQAWHDIEEIDMLDVHYEDMVSDPETQSKRVCQYLGKEWTEDILNFHNSDRTVRTASRDQVRKPIYKSSVKKYEHYTAHLAPLRKGLGLEE